MQVEKRIRAPLALLAACVAACGAPQVAPARPEAPRPALTQVQVPLSDPAEYQIPEVSRAAGEAIFTRTGIGDPYRTGVPFPVFLALLRAYPDTLGPDLPSFVRRFGFLPREPQPESGDADLRAGLPVGMHLTTDSFTGVPFLMTNCSLCHAERLLIDGHERVVIGLGNKRVRIHAYDAAWSELGRRDDLRAERLMPLAAEAAREERLLWPAEWARAFVDASIRALERRARERQRYLAKVAGGPPGLVASVEAFAQALGQTLGYEVATGPVIGWAKIPDVIGYAQRSTLSFDGAATGSKDALVVEADFAAGARLEWFWAHPLQGPSLTRYLDQLPRELPFPGPIDDRLASQGKPLFEASCAGCHGRYDEHGRAIEYEERVIPLSVVGSDPARAEAVTDAYVAAANDPRLSHGLVQARRTLGYVPPVLTDLWARAPYGHAGQWPSIAVLAQAPAARATRFVMDLSGRLDLTQLGVPVRADDGAPLGEYELRVDGSQPGRTPGGHPFLADLPTDSQRALIEYLKTL
jgi:mono/diheme cytochrome c family protein